MPKQAKNQQPQDEPELDVPRDSPRKKSRDPKPKKEEGKQSPAKVKKGKEEAKVVSPEKVKKAKKNMEHLEETKEAPKQVAGKKRKSSSSPEKAPKSAKKSAESSAPFVPHPFSAQSAYTFFVTDFVKNFNEKNPGRTGEAFAEGGKAWKALDEKKREQYEKLAATDKLRLEKQREQLAKKGYFKLQDGSKSTDPKNEELFKKQKKQWLKDPSSGEVAELQDLQPKRPINAYFHFSMQASKEIREKNPGISVGDCAKAVKAKFESLNDDQKAPYVQLNLDDKKRHQAQLEELAEKGYFTLDDGSKSTDEKNRPKPKKVSKKAKKARESKSGKDDDDEEIAVPKKAKKNAKDHSAEIEEARVALKNKKKQK